MVFAPGGAGQSALAVGLAFSLSKRTRLCAGLEHFFIKANVLFCVPKENQKSTSDFDALVARIKFFLSVKWLALRAGQR